jgi:hypothetical protein
VGTVAIDLAMLIERVVGRGPSVQRLAACIADCAVFNLGVWKIVQPRLG